MYRAVSAAVIFDTLWSLISFGHRKLHFSLGRNANIQLPVHLCQAEIVQLTLFTISSESDWSVLSSIPADLVLIGDL